MASTAITPITLEPDAFARMVLEEKLATVRSGGYEYASKQSKSGWELYRTFAGWDEVAITTAATADPAAGANWATITVPAGKRWLLVGMYTGVVTDVNVANRRVLISILQDGVNTSYAYLSGTNQTASLTWAYSWAAGQPTETYSSGYLVMAAPKIGIELNEGAVIAVTITSIQAGDNATALRYAYKEVDV